MRRVPGCGFFSSQRLAGDVTVPPGEATPADYARAQAILDHLQLRKGC
jgi:hypothetical protein